MFPETIIHKIFEINSSFHVKWRTATRVQYPFFKSFWLVLKECSSWQGESALVCNSSKFWDVPVFSLFPKIVSLMSFGNSWDNSYVPCLFIIIKLRLTCGEKPQYVSKYYENDCRPWGQNAAKYSFFHFCYYLSYTWVNLTCLAFPKSLWPATTDSLVILRLGTPWKNHIK